LEEAPRDVPEGVTPLHHVRGWVVFAKLGRESGSREGEQHGSSNCKKPFKHGGYPPDFPRTGWATIAQIRPRIASPPGVYCPTGPLRSGPLFPIFPSMAKLPILEFPDPRLRTVAKPVETVGDDLRRLVDDMFETMYAAPGIGLAATQVD